MSRQSVPAWRSQLVYCELFELWALTDSIENSSIAPSLLPRLSGRLPPRAGRRWQRENQAAGQVGASEQGMHQVPYSYGQDAPGAPLAASSTAEELFARADALIIGGFHHLVPVPSFFIAFLRAVRVAWPALRVVVTDNFRNHFPGGTYSRGRYPPAKPPTTTIIANPAKVGEFRSVTAPCDQWNIPYNRELLEYANFGRKPVMGVGPPGIMAFNNRVERAFFAARSGGEGAHLTAGGGVHLLRVAELYEGRGDAHVEFLEEDLEPHTPAGPKPSKRDCLHLCVAPGVLDALALATLEALDAVRPR